MTASTLGIEHQSCFNLKTSFLPCTMLQLTRYDLDGIEQQLIAAIKQAPVFFAGAPVVIDLEKVYSLGLFNFNKIKDILLANGLVPIGVRSGSKEQITAAQEAGLPLLNLSKSNASDNKKKSDQVSAAPTKLVNTPIRSGMQVYAKDADLIVMSQVSPGAEILADGNIHVYGSLHGRALAGVHGNTDARIFCHSLEAELVSIAGYYLTQEDMQKLPQTNVQIFLENQQVQIKGL
jgi:septum site-determining protein MinC